MADGQFARLSPLTRSGLFANLPQLDPQPAAVLAARHERWRCPDCQRICITENDAIECCPPVPTKVWVDEAGNVLDFEDEGALAAEEENERTCPVCTSLLGDAFVAADCCLWKDIDAPARWRIATAVEGGATWREAVGAETRSHQ